MQKLRNVCMAAVCGVLGMASSALGGAHTWDVVEVFSNADGTIQYIELREMGGGTGEIFLNGLKVTCDGTGKQFTFTSNLVSPTTNKTLLLATAACAAIPGFPTPNGIIDANFFNTTGDTLRYHVYDVWTFGAIPTDCVSAFHDGSVPGEPNGAGAPTPKNYTNGTPTQAIECPPVVTPCPEDITGDDVVGIADLLGVIGAWGPCTNCPKTPCGPDITEDCNVGIGDLLGVIGAWGPCD